MHPIAEQLNSLSWDLEQYEYLFDTAKYADERKFYQNLIDLAKQDIENIRQKAYKSCENTEY